MNARCETSSVWPPRLALLAGGLATRLYPLTAALPKSLVPVAGEPFLAHQLRRLRIQGLREIVICSGHLGSQIEAFAGDGRRFDLSIAYSRDGDSPLGTGGALRAALPLLGPRFLVMYGDSWLTASMETVWRAFLRSGKPALMTVCPATIHGETGNVAFRDGAILLYDKNYPSPSMRHIDYGLEALDAEVPARSTRPAFDLSDVWSSLAAWGWLAGYEIRHRFYEIGSPSGLRETEAVIAANLWAARHNDVPPPDTPMRVRL
jgi:NDP-sugar pyrophosphorylase family protein